MAHPLYLRAKARELRVKNKMSLVEIAECLALGKTTVWYWIRDLPDPDIKYGDSPARARSRAVATRANRERFKALREAAYRRGLEEFETLDAEPGFRDFICMYIGEGYKRNRNRVSVANSDPAVLVLCARWVRRFATNKVHYSLQYHADQDPDQLVAYWAELLGADTRLFRLQRKSNSNQLAGRTWRCRYGVLSVGANDTQFRARLQAWIDRTKESWLHSPHGV